MQANRFGYTREPLLRVAVAALAVFGVVGLGFGQSVQLRSNRPRVTVPLNSTDTSLITNGVYFNNISSPVTINLSVTGLPEGAGYQITDTNGTPITSLTATASGVEPIYIWLYTTNIPQGLYDFKLEATGDLNASLNFILQAGLFWNGTTNSPSWSNPDNWLGGFPDKNSDVIFTDASAYNATNPPFPTTCYIPEDVEIASMRFMQTNANSRYHYIEIAPGKTLKITGTNGFYVIRDFINSMSGLYSATRPEIYFVGTNSTVVISNPVANVAFLIDGQVAQNTSKPKVDFTWLQTLIVDVNRFGWGDYSLYPNYWNFQQNGYGGDPSRWNADLFLAKTNIIRAWYVHPNYTNDDRTFAIMFQHGASTGSTSPYGTNLLGVWNEFYADSICLNGANQQSYMRFSPYLRFTTNVVGGVTNVVTNAMYAKFRNVDGGRVSVFAISDNGGATNAAIRGNKSWIWLGEGTVDILADLFYIARDRAPISGDPNYQGQMAVGDGIIDVNKMILGFQDRCINWTNRGFCQGTLWVTNKALLKVNEYLTLGYAVMTNLDNPNGAWNTWGRLYIGNGATGMINQVLIPAEPLPGIRNYSGDSIIQVFNGGHLILSNKIAGPDKRLSTFQLNNGAYLTLHINGPGPYIYVTNISTVGAGGIINIASVTNIGAYPATVDLISYNGSFSGTLQLGKLPSGMVGTLVPDSANKVIKLTLSTNEGRVLIWKGDVNGQWDTTTENWVRADTGAKTRFVDGDFVVFDDTAVTTNIYVVSDVTPGQSLERTGIVFSNSTKPFTISSSGGQIIGGTRVVKYGAAPVEFNVASEASAEINEGIVTGYGKLGAVKTAAGTFMDWGGQLGALENAGVVVIQPWASANGRVIVAQGGVLTNMGTINTGVETITVSTDAVLYNTGTIYVTVPWTVQTNGLLVNNGVIYQYGTGTAGLNVYGTLVGTGEIAPTGGARPQQARVNLQPGSTLIIGNTPGEIATMTIGTRLDMFAGATVVFDVDPSGTYDSIRLVSSTYDVGWVNFGANASLGATLLINKIGSGSFAPGQELYLFDRGGMNNMPDNNVPAQPGVMPAPGPGLYWDISNMVTNLVLRVGSGMPVLQMSNQGNTNLVFSWPDTYKWWRLEMQTNSLSVGLSTNWVTVPGSWLTNSVTVPINSNIPAVFYRLVYP